MKRSTFLVASLSCALMLSAAMAVGAAAAYRGNVKSKVFHQSSCRHFNCKNCTVTFDTREAAIKAGYNPCKICRP